MVNIFISTQGFCMFSSTHKVLLSIFTGRFPRPVGTRRPRPTRGGRPRRTHVFFPRSFPPVLVFAKQTIMEDGQSP